MTGKWTKIENEIKLKLFTNEYRNDSLNRIQKMSIGIQAHSIITFQIEEGKLVSTSKIEGSKTIEELTKTDK
jgi:hypothetical protein